MSKLLIPEQPLQILPSLAKAIGLNEAIFIQQLHYWLQKSKHEHDGKVWIYNTFEEWKAQLPFWSLRTMQRIVKSLVDQKLVDVHQFGAADWDRKNWYAIEYDKLAEIERQIDVTERAKLSSSRKPKRRVLEAVKMASSYTETTQETTSENTTENGCAPEKQVFEFWQEHFNHPRAVFDEKRRKAVVARLREGFSVGDLILAVRGCKLTPHNMGQNDRQEIYDDIELICRDTSHVERFISRAEMGANGNGHAKPRTASERNVANIKECLDIIRESSGELDSAESECYVPSRALARRI